MVAAALRAQASVAGRVAPGGEPSVGRAQAGRVGLGWLLLLAALLGLAIGVGLALVSMLAPGVLPAIG
jgi:hypothetical protein